jgi:hypothetical protein
MPSRRTGGRRQRYSLENCARRGLDRHRALIAAVVPALPVGPWIGSVVDDDLGLSPAPRARHDAHRARELAKVEPSAADRRGDAPAPDGPRQDLGRPERERTLARREHPRQADADLASNVAKERAERPKERVGEHVPERRRLGADDEPRKPRVVGSGLNGERGGNVDLRHRQPDADADRQR